MELMDWQRPVADKLEAMWADHPYVVNASGMGSGKTYIACRAIANRRRPTLVIAPKSTHSAWAEVAEGMGAEPYLLDVLNPEKISLGKSKYYHELKWDLPDGAQLIVDELHRGASGIESKFSLAMARLKVFHIPALLMSATPADSPLKMRALGFLLDLHAWNPASFYGWARDCGCVNTDYGLVFPTGKKGLTLMADIHSKIKDRMIKIRIEDIPGFPEGIIESVLVDLDKDDRVDMQRAYAEMSERMKSPGKSDLATILRLRERAEWCKASVMAEMACDAVEAGNSAVCFATFRSSLARIGEFIGNRYKINYIHGDQTVDERKQSIAEFQNNDVPIMLGMIQAGGVGVSLHDVHGVRPRMSLITPSYNAPETVQAFGRVRRVGGTAVVQQFVLAAGTQEEKVHKSIQGKLGRIDSLTDGDLTR